MRITILFPSCHSSWWIRGKGCMYAPFNFAILFCFLHIQKDLNWQNYSYTQPPNTTVPHSYPTTWHHRNTQTLVANTTIDNHGARKKVRWSQDDEGSGKCDRIPEKLFQKTLFFLYFRIVYMEDTIFLYFYNSLSRSMLTYF